MLSYSYWLCEIYHYLKYLGARIMDDKQNEVSSLTAKRDELRQRLSDIEKDYKQGLDPNSTERAIQLENAEVLDGIAKAASDELEQIEAKLAALK